MLRDVQTAASELGVGQSTLRRWIREGRLPVVRLGRRVLIRPAALEKFLQLSEQPGKANRGGHGDPGDPGAAQRHRGA